jgi:hypothetical protein
MIHPHQLIQPLLMRSTQTVLQHLPQLFSRDIARFSKTQLFQLIDLVQSPGEVEVLCARRVAVFCDTGFGSSDVERSEWIP